MLQTFTFGGVGRIVNAQASYFRYEAGSAAGADESVRVRADGQDLGTYLPGDSIRLPVPAVRWELVPTSAECTGTVRLGIGDVESARLVGTVRVVDQGAEKSLAGKQFATFQRSAGPVGKHRIVGIKAGATQVVIKRVSFISDAAGNGLVFSGSAAPTDGFTSSSIRNKRLGYPVAQAVRFGAESAAATPTTVEVPGLEGFFTIPFQAALLYELPLTTPIIVPPGYCYGVVSPATGSQISIVVDMEE